MLLQTAASLQLAWSSIRAATFTVQLRRVALAPPAAFMVAERCLRFPRRPDSFLVSNEPPQPANSSLARISFAPNSPRCHFQPQSGARMQPTAQAVGKSARYPSPNGAKDWLSRTHSSPSNARSYAGLKARFTMPSLNPRHLQLGPHLLRQRIN